MECFKLVFVILICTIVSASNTKPHIIVIIADDLGWNDVGFHGSDEIPTPNIDALAYNGVILNSHYVQALCTPSRAAFLTGKYPIHMGMQHSVILESEPRGLDLQEILLPQRLKDNGYSTYAIGKWHLGFYKREYTPTYRGFDSHYGYWQGVKDYYNHMVHGTITVEIGYDLRRNMEVDWQAAGQYSTELFTREAENVIRNHNTSKPMFMYFSHLAVHTGNADNPMQAPDEEIAKFSHIDDPERRIYAAMVSLMDKSVGKVITALRQKQMLENSIILFISDNGASTVGRFHANHGSNYPLKGMKESPWEGGTRCVAAIWSPLIKKPQRVSNHLMHITDWLPTFYSVIGLNSSELENIDGYDMWNAISENSNSPRTELVYNIDEIVEYSAIRKGDWKYVFGTTAKGAYDSWYGSSNKNKSYYYDQNTILTSETASALTGIITSIQIKEKHENQKNKNLEENKFTIQLLNNQTIASLRKSATIECPEPNSEDLLENSKCKPIESPCLFNIKEDPCEIVNLAKERPIILLNLEEMLLKIQKTVVKSKNLKSDERANPKHWNNTWIPWQDLAETQKYISLKTSFWSPLALGLIISGFLAFVIALVIVIVHSVRKYNAVKNKNQPFSQGPISIYTAKSIPDTSDDEKDV